MDGPRDCHREWNKSEKNKHGISSVQSLSFVSDSETACTPGFPVHHQLPELAQTHVHRVGDAIVPFSSCLQSFPESGSFPVSQFFASGGQRTGASASASVLPVNIQDWFPSGWSGWIFLQSKGLSSVFSSTTVWKHRFFSTRPSLWSSSHICTWLLGKS